VGLRRFLARRWWDEERKQEIAAHIAIEVDELVARGMTPEQARAAAFRKFGNPTLVREEIYLMNSIGWMESLQADLRYGIRVLRRSPGFAAVAILSLALGIGANTAMFQLLDVVLLRSLPVEKPQELLEVRLAPPRGRSGAFSGRRPEMTFAIWEQLQSRQQAFSGMFAWNARGFNLAVGGEGRYAQGLFVSGEFFNVLGVPAQQGRVFTREDDEAGCASPGAVISHGFWQRELGGKPAVGHTLTLERQRFDIVGITPPSFFGVEVGRYFDVALPICAEPLVARENSALSKRHYWWLAAIGRLKPGWTQEQAAAHVNAISAGFFEATVPEVYQAETIKSYQALRLTAEPGAGGVSGLRQEYETPLILLLAMTGLVLLIACGNLTNLLLARASSREREISVRLAIGASRRRVVRQLLAESALLAAAGVALGVVTARWLSRLLVSSLDTGRNLLFLDLSIDWRVLSFTALLGVVTCLVFGLMPALRATQTSPIEAIKSGGRTMSTGNGRFGVRRALVVAQVALTLVLLIGALLFSQSFSNLLDLDVGFEQDGLLVADIDRPGYPPDRRSALSDQVLARLRATAGIDAVAQTAIVPLSGSGSNNAVTIEGAPPPAQPPIVNFNWVSPGYFEAVRQALLAGRDFDDRDRVGSQLVAIVTETFVRTLLAGRDPIGVRFREAADAGRPEPVYEIIGVVRDSKYQRLREEQTPLVFAPAMQQEKPWFPAFLVRGPAASALVGIVTQSIAAVDPEIDIQFSVLKTQISDSLVRERLLAMLSSGFGLLAALLSTLGVYGVMSYTVARRTNEIGIRLALGATRGTIVRMVVREASLLLLVGLGAGTLLALAATRVAKSLLFGLDPHDPISIALAVATLLLVGFAATCLPALRAARVAPGAALRVE
jgi:putative ABC transport system permease protein